MNQQTRYNLGSDMTTRLSSRVVQLEMALEQWIKDPSNINSEILKKSFHDPAFNPKTNQVELSKTKYRSVNLKSK